MREYDLIADWYATERTDTTGVPEVRALAASIAPGSLVLDIGCGNGVPLTKALLEAGHRLVGLDSSGRMLSHTSAETVRPLLDKTSTTSVARMPDLFRDLRALRDDG